MSQLSWRAYYVAHFAGPAVFAVLLIASWLAWRRRRSSALALFGMAALLLLLRALLDIADQWVLPLHMPALADTMAVLGILGACYAIAGAGLFLRGTLTAGSESENERTASANESPVAHGGGT